MRLGLYPIFPNGTAAGGSCRCNGHGGSRCHTGPAQEQLGEQRVYQFWDDDSLDKLW